MSCTRTGMVALALLVAGAVAGCGPSVEAPRQVALDFYTAIGEQDGDAACAVLALSVAEAVAEDEGGTCADSIMSGEVGADLVERAGGVVPQDVRVAGRQAQVQVGTDTVFLARSGSGWAVTAAACDVRPERPYDCQVES
jgi:hypothetical protein